MQSPKLDRWIEKINKRGDPEILVWDLVKDPEFNTLTVDEKIQVLFLFVAKLAANR